MQCPADPGGQTRTGKVFQSFTRAQAHGKKRQDTTATDRPSSDPTFFLHHHILSTEGLKEGTAWPQELWIFSVFCVGKKMIGKRMIIGRNRVLLEMMAPMESVESVASQI
mmetsp:Transcript_83488/g.147175  ORF Transcript_83488/g.147175 Transcript_83488/m.147175 type:complete len:110 (-) Transcript_83488:101-430(-)